MNSLLRITLRFVSLGVLTVAVFFGGIIVRLTQSTPESKEKLSKDFGLNTAHADTPTTSVQGVVEGMGSSEGEACESDAPQGDAPESDSDNC